jgi:hypothetical protein
MKRIEQKNRFVQIKQFALNIAINKVDKRYWLFIEIRLGCTLSVSLWNREEKISRKLLLLVLLKSETSIGVFMMHKDAKAEQFYS